MLTSIDSLKLKASKQLDQEKRSQLGQYMTPVLISSFMTSLFKKPVVEEIHLLDAGAGVGSLSVTFLEKVVRKSKRINVIKLTAYELNSMLLKYMTENIDYYKKVFKQEGKQLEANLIRQDFIEDAVAIIKDKEPFFTHAILNPPYKKINSNSAHRKFLREVGIETVNLYSAFISLSIKMLKPKGELVAIIPRSFCNGNYYKSFRKLIIENTSIQHLHLFDSRNDAFKDDKVLQENIIIHLIKGDRQGNVIVSRSTNEKLEDYTVNLYPFKKVVKPLDGESFIHVPQLGKDELEKSNAISYTLADLGVAVSTGPVVDFRSKEHIFKDPKIGTVPLLYPTHFNCKEINWPKTGKKPNAIAQNSATQKMLYPSGYYTVIKRFSSKEEKQRIVARVINPNNFDTKFFGIENHLNVIHSGKKGLSENLAYGIAAYLNSSFVDTHFRSFNGHTQVNAMDLKQLNYPSLKTLYSLGKWAKKLNSFDQKVIDKEILKIL